MDQIVPHRRVQGGAWVPKHHPKHLKIIFKLFKLSNYQIIQTIKTCAIWPIALGKQLVIQRSWVWFPLQQDLFSFFRSNYQSANYWVLIFSLLQFFYSYFFHFIYPLLLFSFMYFLLLFIYPLLLFYPSLLWVDHGRHHPISISGNTYVGNLKTERNLKNHLIIFLLLTLVQLLTVRTSSKTKRVEQELINYLTI